MQLRERERGGAQAEEGRAGDVHPGRVPARLVQRRPANAVALLGVHAAIRTRQSRLSTRKCLPKERGSRTKRRQDHAGTGCCRAEASVVRPQLGAMAERRCRELRIDPPDAPPMALVPRGSPDL